MLMPGLYTFLTNRTISLGPLLITASRLYVLIGIVAGITLLAVITKNNKAARKFSFDIVTNFFVITILTWKLLPILLAPGDIISNPISILYASGGSVGIGLGTVFGIIYLVIKLILFWKHPVGGANGRSPLRDVLKPIVVFFMSAIIVTSSFFLVSWMIRNGDNGFINGNENTISRGERPFAPTVGDMAPDFDLRDIDGNIVSLEDYRGKWVILNFWATWCPPCKAELPTLNRFYRNINRDNVVLLGINATGTERSGNSDVISHVSAFARDEGINFPVLLDFCDNTAPCVSTIYGAGNLPTTVVVSPGGYITNIKTGVVDSFWLRSVVSGN